MRAIPKLPKHDTEDKVWTCFALVTRSFSGKMMKMPRRRAIAMLMITCSMIMVVST